jgi:hypothetical protein
MRSKKRSAANSPPERPVLFVDRSLGKHLVAEALRKTGARVETHDDHFPQATIDTEWLAAVGKKGWVVLSKDTRIRYRPLELAALKAAGVVAVFMVSGNIRGDEMAELFEKMASRIEQAVMKAKPPALFTFGRDGKLKKVDLK